MSSKKPPTAGEARKVVTVLFTDVTGSTVLGQELDPESLLRIMSRYFEEMKSVVERHGGTVEKFAGDAVLAVFGVPRLHEDDALRAVRAGIEMQQALEGLNEEFERTWGVRIETRTGVNTGEVMAGAPGRGESLVIGDAVNVAARLEQAARPGEILLGEATYRLARDAVVAEGIAPLTLKGIARPVPAWRLLQVVPGAPGWTRRLDSPLVGRDRELGALWETFNRSVQAGACELVSVMGPAGVGKSRLASEFISDVAARATVVMGRCLPYGEGITFWPIIEVLRHAAGVNERDSSEHARAKISQLLPPTDESALVLDRLAALLDISERLPSVQETFWGVRKLFEGLAQRRPLVVVFDDLQWAEPTLLDLLEYLAASIRSAPVQMVCLARPEILDSRPGWMGGERDNASVITLEPLGESDIDGLIRNLVGGTELPSEAREHIAQVAEGNPLFIEEILRMLVDDGLLQTGDGRWKVAQDLSHISIPPTIHALLTARLDRLDADERAVIERASIVGRTFWWAAVSALSPEELRPEIGGHLQALMRKELIRPDLSSLKEEDAYQFAHILVRDAAYRAIPKSVRAELHERLAEWIELRTKLGAAEYEEILGYHLEQAYRLLLELGTVRQRIEPLGRRAAAPLASAGGRAFTRGDMPAAVNLLSRAASLLPEDDSKRLDLMPQLAFALMETGDFARLQAVVAEMSEAATASANSGLQAHVLILGLWIRLFTNPEGWAEVAEREATRAIGAFQEIGDERGLARGWSLLGLVHSMRAQFGRAEKAWEQAAAHAHLAQEHRDELESLSWIPLTVWAGPTPAEQGLQRCRDVLERSAGDKKPLATALFMQAPFEAGLGRFDEGRELIARAKDILQEVALTVWIAGPLTQISGWVELTAGDPAAAERELRWGYETLSDIGELSWLSTTAAIMAEAVDQQGRHEEAEELTKVSEQTAGSDDVYSQVLWRSVRGKALAARGGAGEGEQLAAEAVALAETTDFLHLRAHALMSRAEVLQSGGRAAEAVPAATEAARLFEQKGNVVAAARAARLLEKVQASLKSSEA
jgi:class 3 adenylate cyclase/tetratricopeptide (TPR) repeat protein